MSKEKKEKIEVEEKDGTFKFFLIIVLIMAVLSIGCCVGVLIGYNMNKDKDVVEKDDEKDALEPEVEVEVTDEALINDLKRNVSILEDVELHQDENLIYAIGDIYKSNYKKSDISNYEKLRTVLLSLFVEKQQKYGVVPITTDYQFPNGYGENRDLYIQVDVSEVENLYKKLYGESIKEHQTGTNKFNHFFYDSKNQKYYVNFYGGGTLAHYLETYVSKVTMKGNEAFVYVNLGVLEFGDPTVCYSDYMRKNTITCPESGDLIKSDNYEQFSEYRFKFTKKDGIYSFTEIYKIK